jgi:DNA helicase HerA-like ATPase
VGDPEKPRLVFFFDEAHLLFTDAPKALLEKVEQVVRLIRSKGVGIYFVTQNPADVPDAVLGQLGNRIEHGLRAYTPVEQKGLRAAAASFRPNPAFDTAEAIQHLGVGEALVSVLDEQGAPTMGQKTTVRPPDSRIGPVTADERRQLMAQSPVRGLYDEVQDRESAFERLKARAEAKTDAASAPPARSGRAAAERPSQGEQMVDAFAKSMLRSIGTQVGRQIIRGVLGGLMGAARSR